MRLVAGGAERGEDDLALFEARKLDLGERRDLRRGRGAGLAHPREARGERAEVREAAGGFHGGAQFGERSGFGTQPDGLQRRGLLGLRITDGLVEAAEHRIAEVGPVIERDGDGEHLFERAAFTGLRDERGQGFEHRAGLGQVGARGHRGDGLGEGDFAAASAGESAFADEGVLAMTGEEVGKRAVRGGLVDGREADREVREHERGGVILHREQVGEEVRRGQAHGGGADLRVGVLEGGADVVGRDGTKAVQGPERVQACHGGSGRVGEQGAKSGGRGGIAAFDEQALGGVTDPAVGMGETSDAVGGASRQDHLGRSRLIVAHDAPDAALVDGRLKLTCLDVSHQVVRQEAGVLEHAAIHVHDVEGAVRSVGHHHRAETFIGGRKEFRAGMGVLGGDHAVFFRELEALHEIGGRFGDERVATVFGREGVATVDHGAAGGGRAGQRAVFAQCLRIVAAVDAGRRVRREDRLILHHLEVHRGGRAQERIAREGRGGQEVGAKEVGVIVEEQSAGVVLAEAPLAAAEAGSALPRIALRAEAHTIARGVDAIVHRPGRRVGHVFRLAAEGAVVGGHDRAALGFAVAVEVAAEEEVRRFGDECAALDRHHPTRHDEIIGERRSAIHATVSVRVGEQGDSADRFFLRGAVDVAHVAAHFDHEHPTLVVEADRDGRLDHRFGGDEFDAEPGRQAEGLQGFLWREGRRGGEIEFEGDVLRAGIALVQGESGRGSDKQSQDGKRGFHAGF